jgi:hypothetical protein
VPHEGGGGEEMTISRAVFDEQRRPRFGTANPERMRLAFWEWMIRGGEGPSANERSALSDFGLMMRNGILKSAYGPWRARDLFGAPPNREDGPIWTFDRFGRTGTELPDGSLVCVGGEHEDSYDPDFYIYNDVVVLGPNDEVEIYGYPKEVFPPTDFHTATLLADRIILIGRLGYRGERRPGHTPVYSLDLASYRIYEITTTGEMPGWLFKHEAELGPGGVITARGGEVMEERGGEEQYRRNVEEYALDLRSGAWRRLTDRNWRQFAVHQEDWDLFVLEQRPEPAALLPRAIEHTAEPGEEWDRARYMVGGVPVSLIVGVSVIEVIVEGELPPGLADRIAEEVRANAEASIGRRCALRPL